MSDKSNFEIWFIAGSQHLYGTSTLQQVEAHAKELALVLSNNPEIAVKITFKAVVTTAEEIFQILMSANSDSGCLGIITWMHTFSPAKMWIRGLKSLNKPLLHFHTQYNDEIPWNKIDMDFMNLNQSAHGDREFGFLSSRMGIRRKVVAGHWKDPQVIKKIAIWARVTRGWQALQRTKVARFGDNMREVAVTEGDKVEAQWRFGLSVNGFGLGDLVAHMENVSDSNLKLLLDEYDHQYKIKPTDRKHPSLGEAARIELGLRSFLEEGGFQAFTDTFENLHGLNQLPGLPVQRLMAQGYGFGAEGDWKTAALLHAIKVMATGLEGGNSFMEDYTYHFGSNRSLVLGAHMLEICPSIAAEKPRCEIHPLSIGGKADPARLIFEVAEGPAVNVSLMDFGDRFRILVNQVDVVKPWEDLPELPVARALWKPLPDLPTAAHAWILAGGAHHTVFSKAITTEFMEDFAEIAGIELLVIDSNTTIRDFKNSLRWNELYYRFNR